MKHSSHDVLDGQHDRSELTPQELDRLVGLESAIGAVVEPLNSAPVPDVSNSVMARIAAMRMERSRTDRIVALPGRMLGWLWSPRPMTIRMRPVYPLGALGVVLVLAMMSPLVSSGRTTSELVQADEVAAPTIYVQFRLQADGASRVALVGTFSGWQPVYELRETSPGTWSILLPLQPGVYDYAFVVDGSEWLADPNAFQVDDGFGGVNSRIALPSLPSGSADL